jgi:hypothetical protein
MSRGAELLNTASLRHSGTGGRLFFAEGQEESFDVKEASAPYIVLLGSSCNGTPNW